MADVVALGLAGNGLAAVDDEPAFGVEQRDERQPGLFAAHLSHHVLAAGIVERLLFVPLHHDQFRQDKVLLEDGLVFLGLDKLIESAAPPSPRRVERQKDFLSFLGGLSFCLAQNSLRGRGGGGDFERREKGREKKRGKRCSIHGWIMSNGHTL